MTASLSNDAPSHHRSKSSSELQREESDEARVVFEKTLNGQYRNGKTGYRRVGVLLITWEEDDMGCKQQEVDKLEDLFKNEFCFETQCFEIPSERWETALHKSVTDFTHEYNSPENLAIIYYGGHAYEGQETKELKIAAKFQNDGYGDPTAFFNDIQTCLRLSSCDQLVILDCCYSARAFHRNHIGKRKFELLTSAAHNLKSPAPKYPDSFTRALHDTLARLLKDNQKGFCTSQLYREVYHNMPKTTSPKPLLFDQARHSFGKIFLRPQLQSDPPKAAGDGRYLKLKFRLNETPDLAVMNELALHLQYLPHVDQIMFEDLCAPRAQIADFMRMVVQAQKLKPLIRKIHARRQLRKVAELTGREGEGPPSSLIKLHLQHNHHPAYDWNNTKRDFGWDSGDSLHAQTKKHGTWPPSQTECSTNGHALADSQTKVAEATSTVTNGVSQSMEIHSRSPHEHLETTATTNVLEFVPNKHQHKRTRTVSPDRRPSAKAPKYNH